MDPEPCKIIKRGVLFDENFLSRCSACGAGADDIETVRKFAEVECVRACGKHAAVERLCPVPVHGIDVNRGESRPRERNLQRACGIADKLGAVYSGNVLYARCIDVIRIVEYDFDFGMTVFGHVRFPAECVVFVFAEVEQRVCSGNDIIEQERPCVAGGIVLQGMMMLLVTFRPLNGDVGDRSSFRPRRCCSCRSFPSQVQADVSLI